MSSETNVSIKCSVVASGIVLRKSASGVEEPRLRLTFVLKPVKKGAAPHVDLRTWPQAINRMIESGQFRLSLGKLKNERREGEGMFLAVPIASYADWGPLTDPYLAAFKAIVGDDPKKQRTVLNLWQELYKDAALGTKDLADEPDAVLKAIAELFSERMGGCKEHPFLSEDNLPQILGTGRSDAAILTLIHRANVLLDRLRPTAEQREIPAAEAWPQGEALGDWVAQVSAFEDKAASATLSRGEDDEGTRLLKEFAQSESGIVDTLAGTLAADNKGFLEALRDDIKAGATTTKTSSALMGASIAALMGADAASAWKKVQTQHLSALVGDATKSPEKKGDKSPTEREARYGKRSFDPETDEYLGSRLSVETQEVARNFISNIQNSPLLSRLFRFAIDFELPIPDGYLPASADAPVYIHLAGVCFESVPDNFEKGTIITLAKLAKLPRKDKKGREHSFWPASRQEALSDMPMCYCGQIDGVINLGQKVQDGNSFNPRYDLVSIDPLLATDAVCRSARRKALAGERSLEVFRGEQETGLVSRGLSIVDRWRGAAVAREILTAQATCDEDLIVLDAEDMTSGFRVDLAVRTGQEKPQWRSLMEREIDYRRAGQENTHGSTDDFWLWFHALALHPKEKPRPEIALSLSEAELEFEKARRRDLDAAVMMPAARRRRRPGGGDTLKEMIHAEDLLVGWEGDPLGLSCGQDTVSLPAGADLALTRRFNLPEETGEGEFKPYPLRYGWSYRFGMRPVWMGGISVPVSEAAQVYDRAKSGVTLPAGRALSEGGVKMDGWRRFLRHHAIRAPVVLLPKVETPKNPAPKGRMVLPSQSGARVLLRSLIGEKTLVEPFKAYAENYRNREMATTSRIILPPRISLDEAIRHGRFDRATLTLESEQGDFLDMDYDAASRPAKRAGVEIRGQATGFPMFEPEQPLGDLPASRQWTPYFALHADPAAKRTRVPDSRYYIDPMLDSLVVAIRPNGGKPGQGYFPGAPKVIPLKAGSAGKRVQIHFAASSGGIRGQGDLATQESFWGTAADTIAPEAIAKAQDIKIAIEQNQITLILRAGESVDVDCWYVPSEAQLRKFFDWPETIAVMLAAQVPPEKQENLTDYRRRLIRKLLKDLPAVAQGAGLKADAISALLKEYNHISAWAGLGCQPADPALVAVAARLLHAFMLTAPVPEIGAVQTIDAVHAVARPPRKPALDPARKLAIWRAPSDDSDDRVEQLKKLNIAFEAKAPPLGTEIPDPALLRFGKPGQNGFVLGGIARFDRDTCRQLEVRAYATSPAIKALDDIKRGRTELQRLLGEWTERIVPDPAATGESKIKLSRSAQDLYGFDVDTAGNVSFPRQWITLLQIDDLEEHRIDSKSENLLTAFTALEDISLATEQLRTLVGDQAGAAHNMKNGAVRARAQERYADTMARKFQIALRGTTRFDPYFLRLDRAEDQPVPEIIFPPDPIHADLVNRWSYERSGENPASLPLYSRILPEESNSAELLTLWLPATVAPAKPAVDTVLPTFSTKLSPPRATIGRDEICHELIRAPRLRVYLDRPWFSTGEGERLGVILWPPRVSDVFEAGQEPADLGAGRIRRSVLGPAPTEDVMDLSIFADQDLGPGGRFTTRWGADPIRSVNGPSGPFLYWSNLRGNRSMPADATPADHEIGYVDSIEIPLVDLRAWQDKNDETVEALPEVETITAGLATYLPKFDVEREKWFVDIELEPGCLVEPFIRLGLVRYQPEAEARLKVSSPVAVWAQVPMVRQVKVRLPDLTKRKSAEDYRAPVAISVEVTGNTASRSNAETHKIDPLPRMKISIGTRSKAHLADLRFEGVARMAEGKEPASCWVSGQQTIGPSIWTQTFRIEPPADQDLFVTVEEVEEYLSTQNARRIEDSKNPDPSRLRSAEGGIYETGISRSGPRFLARIDLNMK